MSNRVLNLAAAAARLLPDSFKRGLYRIKPLASLIRKVLNRTVPEGLTDVTVAAGGLEGLTVHLNLKTEKDYWLGTYEPELQAAVRHLVHAGDVVYDVGANIGYVSLLLARAAQPGGRVYAFEPLPANLSRMQANLALNPSFQVTAVPAAVVDRSGKTHFWVHSSTSMGKAEGSAGRTDTTYRESIEIDALALDDFAYGQQHELPDVIKMDIEGGEVLAFKGMERLLNQARPTLLVELHGPESARAAWETLSPSGYRLSRMDDLMSVVASQEELDWKAYMVAIPSEKWKAVKAALLEHPQHQA